MKKFAKTLAVGLTAILVAALVASCALITGGTELPGDAKLTSITVAPAVVSLTISTSAAGKQKITVTGHYDDDTTATITNATWATSASSVATVTAGEIVAAGAGTAVITASSGGKSATVAVTVTAAVVASGPSAVFSDTGLTTAVNPLNGVGTTEKAQINGWSGGTDVIDLTGAGVAKITYGGHGNGWSGGVALVQKPTNYTGKYDFTNVKNINFKIKSATIDPAYLTVASQHTVGGDVTATLASFGTTTITQWTDVSISVATFFPSGATLNDVTTALAFYWGSSAGDTTNNPDVGDFFEIGDIEFVDASGNDVAFYSAVALPPVTTGPTALAASPTLAAGNVANIYTADATYTNPTVTWQPGWGGVAISDDTTSVSGSTLKKFTITDATNDFTLSNFAITIGTKKMLHVSVFTDDGGPTLPVKLDYNQANGLVVSATGTITQGQWSDLEYDFSSYTATQIDAFLFNNPSSTGTYWVDNIYFYDGAAPASAPTALATSPSLPAVDVANVYTADNTYTNPTVTWQPGWGGVAISDDTTSVSGSTLKKFTIADATNDFTLSNFAITFGTKKMLHVSVFTANGGPSLPVKLDYNQANGLIVSATGTITQGQWSDLEYDFSSYTATQIDAFLFTNPASAGTYWVDNIYFH